MKTYKAYLAGPIAGLNYKQAVMWREAARTELLLSGIHAYSPMRNKHYLSDVKQFSKQPRNDENPYNSDNPLSTVKGITVRDRFDCETSDLVLINLLGSTTVSIGTMLEIGWASAKNIPIILVMEDEGNPHDHGMVNQVCGFRVNNLEDAIILTRQILLP
jgi:nucleoside 2-deoxyribosyltransferase